MKNDSDYREIYASKEDFDKLRSDKKFANLLNLARAVNAVYFCFNSLLDYSGDETPAGQRQHINGFLFAAGVLHEGFRVAERLEKHFGDPASYRDGFGKLLAEPKTQDLRQKILKRMRNKLVFHYDEDVAKKTLKCPASITFSLRVFAKTDHTTITPTRSPASMRLQARRANLKWLRTTADTGMPNYPMFERDPYLNRIRQAPRIHPVHGRDESAE